MKPIGVSEEPFTTVSASVSIFFPITLLLNPVENFAINLRLVGFSDVPLKDADLMTPSFSVTVTVTRSVPPGDRYDPSALYLPLRNMLTLVFFLPLNTTGTFVSVEELADASCVKLPRIMRQHIAVILGPRTVNKITFFSLHEELVIVF